MRLHSLMPKKPKESLGWKANGGKKFYQQLIGQDISIRRIEFVINHIKPTRSSKIYPLLDIKVK